MLDRNLLYITGKGGVGKSTVAAALGIASAARGKRTIVCEVGEQERVSRLFGRPDVGPGHEVALGPTLSVVSIDPQQALREWLADQIGSRTLVRTLFQSRAFEYFVAAAPGARELVTVTKIWELAQPKRWNKRAPHYDVVVVDAPASGHGLAMLRTPRTFADIARVGPIRNQADRVWDFLTDTRRAAYLAVATAAELPVTETLELQKRLRKEIGRRLEAIVVNGLFPQRFSGADLEHVASAAHADGHDPGLLRAARAARAETGRAKAQQSQLRRLRKGAEGPVVTLPYIFQPELDLDAVQKLATELVTKLA